MTIFTSQTYLITGESKDVAAIVAEATRVLRPGGRLVVCSHHAPDLDGYNLPTIP